MSKEFSKDDLEMLFKMAMDKINDQVKEDKEEPKSIEDMELYLDPIGIMGYTPLTAITETSSLAYSTLKTLVRLFPIMPNGTNMKDMFKGDVKRKDTGKPATDKELDVLVSSIKSEMDKMLNDIESNMIKDLSNVPEWIKNISTVVEGIESICCVDYDTIKRASEDGTFPKDEFMKSIALAILRFTQIISIMDNDEEFINIFNNLKHEMMENEEETKHE